MQFTKLKLSKKISKNQPKDILKGKKSGFEITLYTQSTPQLKVPQQSITKVLQPHSTSHIFVSMVDFLSNSVKKFKKSECWSIWIGFWWWKWIQHHQEPGAPKTLKFDNSNPYFQRFLPDSIIILQEFSLFSKLICKFFKLSYSNLFPTLKNPTDKR